MPHVLTINMRRLTKWVYPPNHPPGLPGLARVIVTIRHTHTDEPSYKADKAVIYATVPSTILKEHGTIAADVPSTNDGLYRPFDDILAELICRRFVLEHLTPSIDSRYNRFEQYRPFFYRFLFSRLNAALIGSYFQAVGSRDALVWYNYIYDNLQATNSWSDVGLTRPQPLLKTRYEFEIGELDKLFPIVQRDGDYLTVCYDDATALKYGNIFQVAYKSTTKMDNGVYLHWHVSKTRPAITMTRVAEFISPHVPMLHAVQLYLFKKTQTSLSEYLSPAFVNLCFPILRDELSTCLAFYNEYGNSEQRTGDA